MLLAAALTKKFAEHGYKVCPARRPRSIDKVNNLAEMKLIIQEDGLRDLVLMQEMRMQ